MSAPGDDGLKPTLQRVGGGKKVIEVGASSLVDLKVELARKRQEYRLQQLDPTLERKAKRPAKGPAFLQNHGVAERDRRDRVETKEETKDLDMSRRMLEHKAALYDKMKSSAVIDDETAEQYLVDFDQKSYDTRVARDTERDAAAAAGPAARPGPACVATDGEPDDTVEYKDEFGRDRRCLRRDLALKIDFGNAGGGNGGAGLAGGRAAPGFVRGGAHPNYAPPPGPRPGGAGSGNPTLLSEDMRRELDRREWEQVALDRLPQGAPVPTHFQGVVPGEIRQLGTGYFRFSTDEEARQAEMKELGDIRDATVEARKRRDNLKRRRQEALEKRLNKIRKRKGQAPVASADAAGPAGDAAWDAPPETLPPTALVIDEADENIDDFLSFYKNKSRLTDA